MEIVRLELTCGVMAPKAIAVMFVSSPETPKLAVTAPAPVAAKVKLG